MSKQAKDLKKLSKEERNKRLTELRLQLMKDRAQVAAGAASKKPSTIRNSKRMIARILTSQNE
jgi:large subunit ribosomal protein L29